MTDSPEPRIPPALSPVGGLDGVPLPLALRVLCVDDNRDAANSVGLLLRLLGADPEVCYDGPTALTAVERGRPDVAVLDINMPGMDGCELAGRLRDRFRDRPPLLVALTAHGDEKMLRRTADAGFDRHLTKPADPRTLIALLADHLRGQQQAASPTA